MQKRGLFISFEGGEGTGKTTVLNYLMQRLTAKGHEVVLKREPGGTVISERIRSLVKDMQLQEMSSRTEALLMAASRAQLIDEEYLPALANGEIVLADRYIDSTYAYQGYGRGLSMSVLKQLNDFATMGLVPDKTFLFDADPRIGHRRRVVDARVDRIELENMDFFDRVRQGFLKLAEEDSDRFVVINASLSIKQVGEEVSRQVLTMLRGYTQ